MFRFPQHFWYVLHESLNHLSHHQVPVDHPVGGDKEQQLGSNQLTCVEEIGLLRFFRVGAEINMQ